MAPRWLNRLGAGALCAALPLALTLSAPASAARHAAPAHQGTRPPITAHAAVIGDVPGATPVSLQVQLEPRNAALLEQMAAHASAAHPLSHWQLRKLFYPRPATVAHVAAYLRGQGIAVDRRTGLTLWAHTSAATAEQTFSTDLNRYRLSTGLTFRAPSEAVEVPAAIDGAVAAVDGLETFPAEPRTRTASVSPHITSCGSGSATGGLQPGQLATHYDSTATLAAGDDGSGESVALIEYANFRPSDIATYKTCYGLTTPVTNKPIAGGATTLNGNVEAVLDADVLMSSAPGLDHIWMYTAPQSASMASVVNTIVADMSTTHTTLISISWGACEYAHSPASLGAENVSFQLAAAAGLSVYAASGDSGSADCTSNGVPLGYTAVDDPASQPYVTGVGGTDDQKGWQTWHTAGNAGGGGESALWTKPSWQQTFNAPGADGSTCGAADGCRLVPDVAGLAGGSGYPIYCTTPDCGSQGWLAVGGTSGAAPLLAALTADMNERSLAAGKTRLGFASPFFYAHQGDMLDVTSGGNDTKHLGVYQAGPGFDAVTGLGEPQVEALVTHLMADGGGTVGSFDETAVTANQSALHVRFGRSVTLSGTLTDDSSGLPLADQIVFVSVVFPGNHRYDWVYLRHTDAQGHWAVTSKTFHSRMIWRADYAGNETAAPSHSATHTLYVSPVLGARLNRSSVPAGVNFTASGTAKPNMSGATVTLQWHHPGGAWHSLGSRRVGSQGGYSITTHLAVRGTYYLRWSYHGTNTSRWLSAVSPPHLLHVV